MLYTMVKKKARQRREAYEELTATGARAEIGARDRC